VTITDALLTARLAVGLISVLECPVGDVNNDGLTNMTDALLIAKLAVGLISQFP
jgi:hypothetical protein